MWFEGALRTPGGCAGQDGWRGAATAPSDALGALFLLLIAVVAAFAYSNRRLGKSHAHIGPERRRMGRLRVDLFPRAMLIMAAAFKHGLHKEY